MRLGGGAGFFTEESSFWLGVGEGGWKLLIEDSTVGSDVLATFKDIMLLMLQYSIFARCRSRACA